MHLLFQVWVVVEELLESKCGDILDFLLEYLVNGVATTLQNVDKIHDLLFSQFEVDNFIV